MENATPPPSAPPPMGNPPNSGPVPPANPNAERTWNMWCHMSALAGLIIPFGNLLGPLIIWQMKRNELPSVDEHGKEAFNFQLSAFIYLLVGGGAAIALSFFCIGFLVIPVLLVIGFGSLIFGVVAGVKANEGILYRYPLSLRLIK